MAYNPAQYYVGGGPVLLAAWDDALGPVYPADFSEIGSVQNFDMEPKVDKIEHETPRDGILTKDDEAVIKTGGTLKLTCDQINQDTLAMFFLGTKVGTNEVELLTNTSQYFSVYFRCKNVKGELWDLYLYKCSVTPSGSYKAIAGKEYNKLELTLELLSDGANHPTGSPFGKLIKMTV